MTRWTPRPGTVYIVGAGPGDPDLMTVRARRVLESAGLVLYADSLVDPRMFDMVAESAQVRGTSGMTLDPIVDRMVEAARSGMVVARVHSGDPGVYGAVAEQLARLEDAAVPWEIVPGVPSPMAAAAALGCEMTVPGVTQSIVFCRVAGRTPMPEGQDLRAHARPGVSLCVFLSAG
jgi:precorrin-4/cobalt-precorrin-4 C11-methyltransferase